MPVQITEAQLFEKMGRLMVEVQILTAENEQLRARLTGLAKSDISEQPLE